MCPVSTIFRAPLCVPPACGYNKGYVYYQPTAGISQQVFPQPVISCPAAGDCPDRSYFACALVGLESDGDSGCCHCGWSDRAGLYPPTHADPTFGRYGHRPRSGRSADPWANDPVRLRPLCCVGACPPGAPAGRWAGCAGAHLGHNGAGGPGRWRCCRRRLRPGAAGWPADWAGCTSAGAGADGHAAHLWPGLCLGGATHRIAAIAGLPGHSDYCG